MKFALSHVADPQMYNPGRRSRKHDPVRKIGVFGYDYVIIGLSMFPQKSVGELLPQLEAMNHREAGSYSEATWNILVEEIPFQTTS